MTELPPIIERLDALYCHAHTDGDCFWSQCPQAVEYRSHCLFDLLLDEEDFEAEEKYAQHTIWQRGLAYPELRAELLRLQEERDSWAAATDRWWERCADAETQRDALLEALKEIVEIGGDGVASQEARIAMQAVANMEGHDG